MFGLGIKEEMGREGEKFGTSSPCYCKYPKSRYFIGGVASQTRGKVKGD